MYSDFIMKLNIGIKRANLIKLTEKEEIKWSYLNLMPSIIINMNT